MIFEFRYKHRTGDTWLCKGSCEKDGSVVVDSISVRMMVCSNCQKRRQVWSW